MVHQEIISLGENFYPSGKVMIQVHDRSIQVEDNRDRPLGLTHSGALTVEVKIAIIMGKELCTFQTDRSILVRM